MHGAGLASSGMTAGSDIDRDTTDDFAELLRASTQPLPIVANKRRGRRRGLIATAIVMVVILGTAGAYVAWALNAPLPQAAVQSSAPQPPVTAAVTVPLSPEGSSAISVSGGDEYLGQEASGIWMANGATDPRSIASITKLIAALVILERTPLAPGEGGPMLTFSEADNDLYDKYYLMGATIAPMPTGSSMSLHDAIATMLLPSASNYAEAVTTWAFGSQSAFLGATKNWLDSHALTGTTIVDPTGISAANTSTTADLVAIGKIATANPVIAALVSQSAVPVGNTTTVRNTNSLLGMEGVNGLKTGNLGDGQFTLLYSASLPVTPDTTLSVVGVVLDGQTRESVNASVLSTLSTLRLGFTEIPLASRDQVVGTATTAWGESAEIVIARNAAIRVWSDTGITVSMDVTDLTAFEGGASAGTITWTAGSHTVEVPLEIRGSIEPPTEFWRLTHPDELWGQ